MMPKGMSDGGMYNIVPYGSYTAYTPALPQFYWDVYSAEQRIKHICYEIDKLANYANYLADTIKKIDAVSPDEFARYKDKLDSEIAALKTEIYDLQVGALSWNVQHGEYTSSKQSQRDMFNDITVHAITVKTLNSLDMTVKDLADCGLNVRGLAVMSYWLVQKFDIPDYFENIAESGDASAFSVFKLNTAKVDADTGTVYIPEEFRA